MGGLNRGRITVDIHGAWRLYTNTAPAGCRMLGTVERDGDVGALALTEAGIYSMVNARVFRALDQRKVCGALAEARSGSGGAGRGQGAKAADGVTDVQRYNVTLDAASDAAARHLGGGDRSLGIRRAVAHDR